VWSSPDDAIKLSAILRPDLSNGQRRCSKVRYLDLGLSGFFSEVTALTAAPAVWTPAFATVATVVTARSATAIMAHPLSKPIKAKVTQNFMVYPAKGWTPSPILRLTFSVGGRFLRP
jgi:hypothetical protein